MLLLAIAALFIAVKFVRKDAHKLDEGRRSMMGFTNCMVYFSNCFICRVLLFLEGFDYGVGTNFAILW